MSPYTSKWLAFILIFTKLVNMYQIFEKIRNYSTYIFSIQLIIFILIIKNNKVIEHK